MALNERMPCLPHDDPSTILYIAYLASSKLFYWKYCTCIFEINYNSLSDVSKVLCLFSLSLKSEVMTARPFQICSDHGF